MAKAPAPKTEDKANQGLGIKEIEKKYGKNTIMRLGDKPIVRCPNIPTGIPGLDMALGIGGIPKGRIIEIYGPESSGKTTLTLHILAQAQRNGCKGAFIDAEHALDPTWAGNIGVDVDNLLLSQPDNGEQALDIVEMLVKSGDADFIIVDSVAALVPKAEIEGEMGDSHMGLQARLMSQGLRKLTGIVHTTGATVIFINQIREKIGVMFGSPETTTGGRALKFYASVRIDIRRKEAIKDKEIPVGNKAKIKIVKNKIAPPFRELEVSIYYGNPIYGIDGMATLLEVGLKHGLIEKSGSWFNGADGTRLGAGYINSCNFLRSNPDYSEKIRLEILKLSNGVKVVDPLSLPPTIEEEIQDVVETIEDDLVAEASET